MQQWRKLKEEDVQDPNPRQQMLEDMATFIKSQIMKGNEIIVLIDANSNARDGSITKFLTDTGLFDLMEDYLPDDQPSTYQRG